MSKGSTGAALMCSVAAHLTLVLGVGVAATPAAARDASPASDPWHGDTFELAALLPGKGQPEAPDVTAPTDKSEPAGSPAPATERERAAARPEPAPQQSPRRLLVDPASPALQPGPARRSGASSTEVRRSDTAAPTASAGAPQPPREGAESGGAGTSGAAGMAGVRNLPLAFTRAVPMAASGDPAWGSLPLGDAGSCELRIEVNEDGRIVSAAPLTSPLAGHLQRLVERTLTFLRAGRFALSHAGVGAGTETLRISVVLSEVEGGVPEDDSSAGPYALGFEPPQGPTPGRAWFTLRSGRHVEVAVRIVGSGR